MLVLWFVTLLGGIWKKNKNKRKEKKRQTLVDGSGVGVGGLLFVWGLWGYVLCRLDTKRTGPGTILVKLLPFWPLFLTNLILHIEKSCKFDGNKR